jgi:hypothetical protein
MRPTRLALVLAAFLACAASPACDAFGSSKVGQGQLYQSGDGRYDPYFVAVHEQQVAAASWPDDKKAARRPLVGALSLTPSASDDTLVSATRERVAKTGSPDGALSSAVDETKRAEAERVSRLKAASLRLDELAKQGKGYDEEAKKEYENRGAMKADEKKSDKMREVRRELDGAVDAMTSLSKDAKNGAKAAEDFMEDLGQALAGKETPKRRDRDHDHDHDHDKPSEEKKPPPPPADKPPPAEKPPEPPPPPRAAAPKPKPKPPAEKPAPPPAEKPAPPPQEKPKPPDEVFNP